MKQYMEAGEVVSTHGMAGELRLYPWCDEPAFLSGFETLYLGADGSGKLEAERIRPHKSVCIVKLAGVNSIEQARGYIGKTLWIARSDVSLPRGSYFVQDLLGASVVDAETARVYGTIAAITHPGRHDVYEVACPGGTTALFPAAPPFIERTDIEGGAVYVRPIAGMFEDDGRAGENGE